MNTRRNRAKRAKFPNDDEFVADYNVDDSTSSHNEHDDDDERRRDRIRNSNREHQRKMTILDRWSDHWQNYETREGEAYTLQRAKEIMKKSKKITCPIQDCGKSFISIGGLRYHYARCNVEQFYTCKACNPETRLTTKGELLRHMILLHLEDLPALDEEQRTIVARSYLINETKVDKSKKEGKRVACETETVQNIHMLVAQYDRLRRNALLSESFSSRPFADWQTSFKDWDQLTTEYERKWSYPPETESPRFRSNSRTTEWSQISAGQATILTRDKKGEPLSATLFTGGLVTAIAWLPKTVSVYDCDCHTSPELLAIAVSCASMDCQSAAYKNCQEFNSCIQFWTFASHGGPDTPRNSNGTTTESARDIKLTLSYMIAQSKGFVLDLAWCPLGASWQMPISAGDNLPRAGLLALACGDGQVRIISVPHTQSLLARVDSTNINRLASIQAGSVLERTPMFRVKPIALLKNLSSYSATEFQQANACKSIAWNEQDHQRLVVAGYANGNVALFDLANRSPILYMNYGNRHIYRPIKSWVAHGGPVTAVAVLSKSVDETLIATGSTDRQTKIWNPFCLSSCITADKAPVNRVLWDFRFRGVTVATDTAFTGYQNRVSYRYPSVDGFHTTTLSTHRSTVLGLSRSIVTNSVATADGAGELFVIPQQLNKNSHRKERGLNCTHSLFSLVPQAVQNQALYPLETTVTNDASHERPSKQALAEEGSENQVDENGLVTDADFSVSERPLVNRPTKFLLPADHRPIETYQDFKDNFGLEFVHYNTQTTSFAARLPESSLRAKDLNNIYCDRVCDYPFASINALAWSPNVSTFQYLLSACQVGLCRLDRVHVVEQLFQGFVQPLEKVSSQAAPNNSQSSLATATSNSTSTEDVLQASCP